VSRRSQPRREIFECPQCGADVPVGARACRECGSDAATGWQSSEEIDYQSLDLPQGYGEDGGDAGPRVLSERRSRAFVVVAIVAAAAVLALALLYR
jgi:hypothetical protein